LQCGSKTQQGRSSAGLKPDLLLWFSELLSAVEHGEEITITRHGSPVARLVAVNAPAQLPDAQSQRVAGAIAHLRLLGSGAELGCTVQQAIQEGRD
jgi:antitoxin (DNA-binding transcriptional repressor) of toxin-antitoxin stability system